MSRHRASRIHVCMKKPCSYCAARSNAQHPPDSVGGYAEMMTAVANELRRRTVTGQTARTDPQSPERSSARTDLKDR